MFGVFFGCVDILDCFGVRVWILFWGVVVFLFCYLGVCFIWGGLWFVLSVEFRLFVMGVVEMKMFEEGVEDFCCLLYMWLLCVLVRGLVIG